MGNITFSKRARIEIIVHEFKWRGGGKEVFISGSFTDWELLPMVQRDGEFSFSSVIPEGDHEYKFKVDGQWLHDPNEPTVDNAYGSKNNVISVKKPDFGVNEALAADDNGSTYSSSPPGPYTQEIPQFPSEETVGPPVWPRHLLDVILNRDVPASVEPNLLPTPSHVTLNHLCTKSSKDDVLIISNTHNFKEKSVTTILFKPI